MSMVLLKLLLLPPELLKTHVQGYADLAGEEWAQQLKVLKTRWLLYALCAASGVLGLFLAGVSLLLWSALPTLDEQRAWIMWLAPTALCLCSVACGAWARHLQAPPAWGKLKAQIALDVLALRQSQEP